MGDRSDNNAPWRGWAGTIDSAGEVPTDVCRDALPVRFGC